MLARKTLWSVLVSALAAIPALQGLRTVAPIDRDAGAPVAPAAEIKTEAAPIPETRRVFEESRVRQNVDDAPARASFAAQAAVAAHPTLADAARVAILAAPEHPEVEPVARRALGRVRVRAPDLTTGI